VHVGISLATVRCHTKPKAAHFLLNAFAQLAERHRARLRCCLPGSRCHRRCCCCLPHHLHSSSAQCMQYCGTELILVSPSPASRRTRCAGSGPRGSYSAAAEPPRAGPRGCPSELFSSLLEAPSSPPRPLCACCRNFVAVRAAAARFEVRRGPAPAASLARAACRAASRRSSARSAARLVVPAADATCKIQRNSQGTHHAASLHKTQCNEPLPQCLTWSSASIAAFSCMRFCRCA
jgi:hypothetical protein